MPETIALACIIVIAGLLQGLTGFGFGLIALPLLGFFIPLKTVIPLIVLLAIFISLILSIQLRQSIVFKNVGIMFLATLPGIPLGAYFLKHMSVQPLSLALGVIMIAFTSYQLFVKPRPRALGVPYAMTAGFGCGFLTGCIGAGGPPAIIYTTIQPWSKDIAKANLALYFLLTGTLTSASHAMNGMISNEVLHYWMISLPALVVGIIGGTFAYRHISDHGYKKMALLLVFILGCMMIVKNV